MVGGEIYVKKIPSMAIGNIAEAAAPGVEQKVIGIRPGEKIHEQMIGLEDAKFTYEYEDYFKILPVINNWSSDPNRIGIGRQVPEGFSYSSDTNKDWMSVKELGEWIELNKDKMGKI